jgi:hypothetical protein
MRITETISHDTISTLNVGSGSPVLFTLLPAFIHIFHSSFSFSKEETVHGAGI